MPDINTTATVGQIPWLDQKVDVAGNFDKGASGPLAIRQNLVNEYQAATARRSQQAAQNYMQQEVQRQQQHEDFLENVMGPLNEKALTLQNQQAEAAQTAVVQNRAAEAQMASIYTTGGGPKEADGVTPIPASDPRFILPALSIVANTGYGANTATMKALTDMTDHAQLAKRWSDQVSGRIQTATIRADSMENIAEGNQNARIAVQKLANQGRLDVQTDRNTGLIAWRAAKNATDLAHYSDVMNAEAAQQLNGVNSKYLQEQSDLIIQGVKDGKIPLDVGQAQLQTVNAHAMRLMQQNRPTPVTPQAQTPNPTPAVAPTGQPGLYPVTPETVPSGGMEEAVPGYKPGRAYRSNGQKMIYKGGNPNDESSWTPAK